jgi:hypothetical protein
LIQDQKKLRNLESKISLPGFHRFKFQFHSFFAETFSTVSVKSGPAAMSAPMSGLPPEGGRTADIGLTSETCHEATYAWSAPLMVDSFRRRF